MKKKQLRWIAALTTSFSLSLAGGAISLAMDPVDKNLFPYDPSLVNWEKTSAPFTPPETCAECHPQQYEEWTASVHALAFKDPIYQGELNKAVKEVGHEISRQCEGCHSPMGVVTGEVKGPGLKGLSSIAMNGVSCDVCHSIKSHNGWLTPYHQPENGSFVMSPGRDGADGPVLTKFGPYAATDGCGDGFHECVENPLHKQTELCANCHQVHHFENHTPLESTYREWKDSPYSVKNIGCQDCHMVDFQTFLRSADTFTEPQRGEFRHYFNGANFLLYHLAAEAAKKAGDTALEANARSKYELAVNRLKAAVELEVTPIYRDKALAEVRVRVHNRRAGHNLPTSLTNIRQVWLEMTVKDQAGKVIMTTGTVKPDGTLPEEVRLFNSDGMGKNLHLQIDPWKVVAFSRHDTIPPKGYKDVYYGVTAPQAKGPLAVEVKLRYRQAEQAIAEALLAAVPADINLEETYGLKEVPTLPVVDMVATTVSLAPVQN